MKCPRCADPMGAMDSGEGITLDFCRGCGGVWLDAGEMSELMQFLEAEPPTERGECGSLQLTCPSCDSPLSEVEHPPGCQVLIDICSACSGIWLDRGELGKLRELARTKTGRVAFIEAHQNTPVPDHPTEDEPESGDRTTTRKRPVIIPILKIEESEAGDGIHWKWVIISTLIMLAGLGGVALLAEAMIIADAAISEGHAESTWVVGGLCVGAFFLGGVMCGWKSPGFTIWEPAISVIPAGLIFCGVFAGFFSLTALGVVLGLGIVVAVLGGLLGERYGHH